MFAWKRYWRRRDATSSRYPQVDFSDAEETPHPARGEVDFDTASAFPCLVLLGEPGIGKSTAIRVERATVEAQASITGDRLLWCDLKEYGDAGDLRSAIFDAPIWRAWTADSSTLHLFLDSLDECRLMIKNVGAILSGIFQNQQANVSRLRLRVACRTAVWPATLDDTLISLWRKEGVGRFELAPLRKEHIAVMTREHGEEPEPFLEEIAAAGAEAFAERPVTLEFLWKLYRSGQRLPRDRADLYQQGCLLLATETSTSRRDAGWKGNLDPEERLAIAGRIAATLLFCRRAAVNVLPGSPVAADDLALGELCGDTEPVAGRVRTASVSQDALDEVLDTGLFEGRGHGRHGFAHQTYAEFLAARYLVDHGLDPTQIGRLIFQEAAGEIRVIPPLAEVAGWLAALQLSTLDQVLTHDPPILLRSAVLRTEVALRPRLVDTLLDFLRAKKVHGYDSLAGLDHPGITEQLAGYLRNQAEDFSVREATIQIARESKVQTAEEPLLALALDESDNAALRRWAVLAVAEIGTETAKRRLRSLLRPEVDQEIRGCVLRTVWPGLISVEEVFANVVPSNTEVRGLYAVFIESGILPHLDPKHLPLVLGWARNYVVAGLGCRHCTKLVGEIVGMSLGHLEGPGVASALAELLRDCALHTHRVLPDETTRPAVATMLDDPERRHRLLEAMLPFLAQADWSLWNVMTYSAVRPTRAEDFDWFREQLASDFDPSRQAAWTRLFLHAWDRKDPQQWDAVVEAARVYSAVGEATTWLWQPVELDSPEADRMREEYQKEEKWRSLGQPQVLDPAPKERIEDCLRQCENGDPNGWWILNREMTLEPTSRDYGDEFDPDLTTLPGWRDATPDVRKAIIQAAERYLQEGEPAPDQWIGQGKLVIFFPAAAGYRALRLLWQFDQNFVNTMPIEQWKKWAPAILGYCFGNISYFRDGVHPELLRLVYRQAPTVVLETLASLIRDENDRGESIQVHHTMEGCWDAPLADALLSVAREPAIKPSSMENLLKTLLEHGDPGAQAYAEELLTGEFTSDENREARARHAASALLANSPNAGWPTLWPLFQTHPSFGCAVIENYAHRADRLAGGALVKRLSEVEVGDLYLWLCQLFPLRETAHRHGAHFVSPRESAESFRDGLLRHLQERGTLAACQAIERVALSQPDYAWMTSSALINARDALRRQSWTPLDPAQLRELARRSSCGLVTNAAHLLEVIVESLERLQTQLQGVTPAAVDLWDEVDPQCGLWRPKDENRLADYIERHLRADLAGRGIVGLREVVIRRGEGRGANRSPGERTDVHVVGMVPGATPGTLEQATVIIEVKGSWNDGLKRAMKTQLADRYLRDSGCHHGLYLVGWYACPQWDPGDRRQAASPNDTQQEIALLLEDQARHLCDSSRRLRAFVLNAGLR